MKRAHSGSSGQAIVELVVAMVALLAVFGGLLLIGKLGLAQTQAMAQARRQAGYLAMLDNLSLPDPAPDYITNRTVGTAGRPSDGQPYSRDDGEAISDGSALQAHVVFYGHPDQLVAQAGSNAISGLNANAFPQQAFGFVNSRVAITVSNTPVVRHLLYAADEIEVEGNVWMTWTKIR